MGKKRITIIDDVWYVRYREGPLYALIVDGDIISVHTPQEQVMKNYIETAKAMSLQRTREHLPTLQERMLARFFLSHLEEIV